MKSTAMSNSSPRGWLNRYLNGCIAVLAGSVAVYAAVQLIEAVWVVLVIVGGIMVSLSGLAIVLRQRHRGW